MRIRILGPSVKPCGLAKARKGKAIMEYVETRGSGSERFSFSEVVRQGLGPNGGLFVPRQLPVFLRDDWPLLARMSYEALAANVTFPYVERDISFDDWEKICANAYSRDVWGTNDIVPLRRLSDETFILDLSVGPTLAFKDFGMLLAGPTFQHVLAQNGQRLTVVVATSGDTGSAAIEALKGRPNITLFVLYPRGKVSDTQRKQMTTVRADNVHVLAVDGATFDDCQDMVKKLAKGAVNSINWVRIMAQVVYYFSVGVHGAPFEVIVPTGNLGDGYAAFVAREMGLPISRIILATNENLDRLSTLFSEGVFRPRTKSEIVATDANAMDVGNPSNLERLIWSFMAQHSTATERLQHDLSTSGSFTLPPKAFDRLATSGISVVTTTGEERALAANELYESDGMLVDPHTAAARAAGKKVPRRTGVTRIQLSTASAVKFPLLVPGAKLDIPQRLSETLKGAEHITTLPNDLPTVRDFIEHMISLR